MFVAFLQRRGTPLEARVQAHAAHFKEGRWGASVAELADMHAILDTKGVVPVLKCITSHCQQRSGQKSVGLWSFVAPFRAERSKQHTPGSASAEPACETRPFGCVQKRHENCWHSASADAHAH